MRPYRRTNKAFMVEYKLATRLGRLKVLVKEFLSDVRALWHYGAPFPTFLKLVATLLLILLVLMPLLYPIFVAVVTYFIFEGLFLSLAIAVTYIIGERLLALIRHLFDIHIEIDLKTNSKHNDKGSWWMDQPNRFYPAAITKRAIETVFQTCSSKDMWKVREVFTRGILLAHSLATSVDYLCVMQGLLDES